MLDTGVTDKVTSPIKLQSKIWSLWFVPFRSCTRKIHAIYNISRGSEHLHGEDFSKGIKISIIFPNLPVWRTYDESRIWRRDDYMNMNGRKANRLPAVKQPWNNRENTNWHFLQWFPCDWMCGYLKTTLQTIGEKYL